MGERWCNGPALNLKASSYARFNSRIRETVTLLGAVFFLDGFMDAKSNDQRIVLTNLEKQNNGPINTEDYRLKTREVVFQRGEETDGDFLNERQGKLQLVELLRATGAFHIYDEVTGMILQPRAGTTQLEVRCDLLLTPTKRLIDAGYKSGAICIECKASGKKMGPAICQGMDYLRSAFALPVSKILVVPSYCFIWSAPSMGWGTASISTQHNVGGANCHQGFLSFNLSGGCFLKFDRDGEIVKLRTPTSGRKTGSR